MNKRNIIIVALATATIGTGAAIAGGKSCGGHFGGHHMDGEKAIERMVDKMDQKLELSDDQEAQIITILTSNMDGMQDLRETRKMIHSEVRSLDPTSPDYQSKVNALADQMATTVKEKTLQAADVAKQVSDVLNEEQRAEAMEMIHARMDHRKKWHDKEKS